MAVQEADEAEHLYQKNQSAGFLAWQQAPTFSTKNESNLVYKAPTLNTE